MQCQFRMWLLLSLLYPLPPPQWLALVLLNTHWLQHSKLKKITNMAPKLQNKTLETKAQTCPPSEEFPGEAAAESSGDVSDRMTCISFHDCKNTALKSFWITKRHSSPTYQKILLTPVPEGRGAQYGLLSFLERLSCTFSRFIPIWNPFIDWMAACAETGLS